MDPIVGQPCRHAGGTVVSWSGPWSLDQAVWVQDKLWPDGPLDWTYADFTMYSRHVEHVKSYVIVALCMHCRRAIYSKSADTVLFIMHRDCELFFSQRFSHHCFKSYVSWHQ